MSESWEIYGPNGEEVKALIERMGRVTEEERDRLSSAWDAARGATVGVARDAAWGAAREAERIAAWDAAWDAAWEAAWAAPWGAPWRAAQVAARRAVLALVVRDLISEKDFDLLYGPWSSVIKD